MVFLLNCTWGLLQSAFGVLLALLMWKRNKLTFGRSSIAVILRQEHPPWFALSLGTIIIVPSWASDATIKHEEGHCRQSAMLGPLYPLLVALPSFLRYLYARKTKKSHKWYQNGYPEQWADRLGGV